MTYRKGSYLVDSERQEAMIFVEDDRILKIHGPAANTDWIKSFLSLNDLSLMEVKR